MSNQLSEHDYIMVKDALNAIKMAECEDFVKNFDNNDTGFMFSQHPLTDKIYQNIKSMFFIKYFSKISPGIKSNC